MNQEEFAKYRHDAVHGLMDLNDECNQRYTILAWPRFDYDLDAGTLVFSEHGKPKVIASIQVAGTTSNYERTWMWGWANPSLPERVIDRLPDVRAFGETEGIRELTDETLPDDEYLGWAMTAIAARILGGKGGYRVPDDDGFIYFVYMDIQIAGGDAPTEDATEVEHIECVTHGKGISTFVCEHLVADPAQVWFSSEPDESNRWPDAWCARCEQIFHEQGEWNELNETRINIKLLCHRCYESNRKQSIPA
jgi:hypothetical protein